MSLNTLYTHASQLSEAPGKLDGTLENENSVKSVDTAERRKWDPRNIANQRVRLVELRNIGPHAWQPVFSVDTNPMYLVSDWPPKLLTN